MAEIRMTIANSSVEYEYRLEISEEVFNETIRYCRTENFDRYMQSNADVEYTDDIAWQLESAYVLQDEILQPGPAPKEEEPLPPNP